MLSDFATTWPLIKASSILCESAKVSPNDILSPSEKLILSASESLNTTVLSKLSLKEIASDLFRDVQELHASAKLIESANGNLNKAVGASLREIVSERETLIVNFSRESLKEIESDKFGEILIVNESEKEIVSERGNFIKEAGLSAREIVSDNEAVTANLFIASAKLIVSAREGDIFLTKPSEKETLSARTSLKEVFTASAKEIVSETELLRP
jgi:hypothetical protein